MRGKSFTALLRSMSMIWASVNTPALRKPFTWSMAVR